MGSFPWYAWIGLLGVIGWTAATMSGVWLSGGKSRRRSESQLLAALDDSAASNRRLAEQLDQMDKRLAAIEKTLTEIP
jgi:hypothetical protein